MGKIAPLRQSFLEFMADDFNTGGALGILHEMLPILNRFADQAGLESAGPAARAREEFHQGVLCLRELFSLMGLFLEPISTPAAASDQTLDGVVRLLIDLRADARKNKNFALADQIRKRLTELNITLEDRQGETTWRQG